METRKYYAVAAGRMLGVFKTEGKCQKLVAGFPDAKYGAFETSATAIRFVRENFQRDMGRVEVFAARAFHLDDYAWAFLAYKGDKLLKKSIGSDHVDDLKQRKEITSFAEIKTLERVFEWANAAGIYDFTLYHNLMHLDRWVKRNERPQNPWEKEFLGLYKPYLRKIRLQKVKPFDGIDLLDEVVILAKDARKKEEKKIHPNKLGCQDTNSKQSKIGVKEGRDQYAKNLLADQREV